MPLISALARNIAIALQPGFVQVLENLKSHGISIFQNPGLEILENQF
jgi:hypothetical protein